MLRVRLVLPSLLLFVLAACASEPPAREDWRHSNVDARYPLKHSTQWVAESAGWQQSAARAFREATHFVTREAKRRERGSWAVVLDIDETVLSNVEYHIMLDRKDKEFSQGSWRDWVEERSARPVPDAFTFMDRVNALGGKVAFVTNRMSYEKAATIDNLSLYGFVYGRDYEVLIPRNWPDGESNKDRRFADAERELTKNQHRSVRVIAYIGDQLGDQPSALGEARFFCVPQGGLYGTPCENAKQVK